MGRIQTLSVQVTFLDDSTSCLMNKNEKVLRNICMVAAVFREVPYGCLLTSRPVKLQLLNLRPNLVLIDAQNINDISLYYPSLPANIVPVRPGLVVTSILSW